MAFNPADTSRVGLGLVEENTFGVFPGGSLDEIRFTQESLGLDQSTTQSNEIRADQQIPDIIRTDVAAQGAYQGELSYDVLSWEKIVKALLGAGSDFSTPPSAVTGTLNATASSNEFDDNGDGLDFSSISQGDWIRTDGFSNDANNGYFQVTAIDTNSTPQTITVVGDDLVDETGDGDESVQGSAALRNDINEYSFSIEKQFNDLSLAARILGWKPSGLTFTLNPGEIVTFSWDGQGARVTDTNGTDLTDTSATLDFTTLASVNAAAANDIMSTSTGIADVVINRDSPFNDVTAQSISLNPQRNLREQDGLQNGLGPLGIASGQFSLSGNLTAYFENKKLLEEYLLFRETDIAVAVDDGAGNAYLIDVPAMKLGGDAIPKASGNNEDALLELNLNGYRSTRDGLDYTFAIHKFSA